ncbi:MAG: hypothetical protein RLY21_780 [Planctomycetota bacterium]
MTNRTTQRPHSLRRRGMASVFALLLLVVLSSLAASMAVVAQANLRAADGALLAARAQGAAESGLVFAAHRLARESSRFVVARGVVDDGFATRLWSGSWTLADGAVSVLPPEGFDGPLSPAGLAEALRDAHDADRGTFAPDAAHGTLPSILADGVLVTRPLRLEEGDDRVWFQVTYARVEGTPNIRVTALGVAGDIRRTLSMDFRLGKRIEYALLSPNRVMIGKNVLVEGPLGTRYGTVAGELTAANGDPLVMRSDFRDLSTALDARLDALVAAVAVADVDGDGRLRPAHSLEGGDLDVLGFTDVDGNGFVDDFDLFLGEFDADGDGGVVWDETRTAQAGLGELSAEFTGVDDQLARLIDLAVPDRNDDGVVDARDVRLGYSDGVLNSLDVYAKVHGNLAFGVEESAWEGTAGEPWQQLAQGPIAPSDREAAARFEVDANELREINTDDFSASAQWFSTQAQSNFDTQANAGLADGGSHTPAAVAPFEAVPYGSPTAYDFYQRPIYEGITFTDVRIPKGLNALFRDCTFLGTCYLETETACTDTKWNYAGALKVVNASDGSVSFAPRFPSVTAQLASTTLNDTRPHSNSIRFDGCTFLGSIAGDTPAQYTHWRNKVQITGATRFYSDPDDPEIQLQPDAATLRAQLLALGTEKLDRLQRSSIMLPGWSVDVGNFTNEVASDPDLTPRVRLRGTIVAGVMDIRGTADLFGTLLMTFRPVAGQGPLSFNGIPESFNTTIGYFGTSDGDGEGALPGDAGFAGFGEIRLRYDPDAKLPDGVPWPISVDPVAETYREGAAP